MKHTYQLRGMAFTLRIRTTISPRRWQPWTAGIAVGYMNGRTRQQSKTLYYRGERKEALLWASAPPRSWYVWFSAKIGIFSKLFGHTGQFFRFHLHTHAVGELFCGSQLTATTCLRWSWCKAVLLCTSFGNRGSLLHGFARRYTDTRDNCPSLPLLG